ncbi:2-hydroxyacid dehydrogenase [Vibrio rumoiensis]|uniref:Glyoxylate/hydroxypyruvate reductase B n=1 Tax=Vibrio rumoiensis 1S-45 TaxID=1188252 RepID=A0A1E5E4Z7_9VIBR|nr:D-glycerate dehydrogenase [Vibrio rumoiensis]OEF28193.1 bifunctional glyoxylate/hydroxypyruvate reductase B [Vibrio rumoiensis 1S-45]
MKKKVVLYTRIPEAEFEKLNQDFDLIYFDGISDTNRQQFLAEIETAHALIGASVKLGYDELKHTQNLQVVSTISTGVDAFDIEYLNQRKIALMHTPDAVTNTTADTIFALMMCTARRTTELNNLVTRGDWKGSIKEQHFGVDLHGKTLGILGMGRIGYALAKRAHCGFDMNINYYNRSHNIKAEENLSATKLSLDDLLEQSDFVCSILPANAQTDLLIGQREFELMKPSAIFINGGRGNVVDEEALVNALSMGSIRAAGLDVYKVEPLPTSSPLMLLDNVVLLPHVGSATAQTRLLMVQCAISNVHAALQGNIVENCANAEAF